MWRNGVALYSWIFLFLSGIISAQSIQTLKGTITDKENGQPLPYAAVIIKGTNISAESNGEGEFEVKVKALPVTLVAYKTGYETQQALVSSPLPVKFELIRKVNFFDEVIITSKRTDTLQQKNNTVFLAFEFYDNLLIALVNKGNRYNYIQVLEEDGKILFQKKAPIGAEELYKDCLGNIQLLSRDSSWQVYYDYQKIAWLPAFPIAIFNLNLRPCQCSFRDLYYFKEVKYRFLKNEYSLLKSGKPESRKLFARVDNNEAISAFNADYDITYFLKLRRRGENYLTSIDEINNHIDEYREQLVLPLDYQNLLAPAESQLVKTDSSLLLFDFTHKKIEKYNFMGYRLSYDTIIPKVLPAVVQDYDSGEVYFIQDDGSSFDLIPHNKTGKKYSIAFRSLANLRIRNRRAYFITKDPVQGKISKIVIYKL